MPFQLRSFNTGLAVICLASSLLGFCLRYRMAYCVISNSITTIVIHTTQHHYQSLTTPNDVTIPFAAKFSIIIPFDCHTFDLFFFLVTLSAFSTPIFSRDMVIRSLIGSFCDVSRPSYMRVIFQSDA